MGWRNRIVGAGGSAVGEDGSGVGLEGVGRSFGVIDGCEKGKYESWAWAGSATTHAPPRSLNGCWMKESIKSVLQITPLYHLSQHRTEITKSPHGIILANQTEEIML